jgi:hypothetical protein
MNGQTSRGSGGEWCSRATPAPGHSLGEGILLVERPRPAIGVGIR